MNKFKTYAFWVALSSAVVILVQSLGKLLGVEIESVIIENVIMSICGILVVLGIVTKNSAPQVSETPDKPNSIDENVDDCQMIENDGVYDQKHTDIIEISNDENNDILI